MRLLVCSILRLYSSIFSYFQTKNAYGMVLTARDWTEQNLGRSLGKIQVAYRLAVPDCSRWWRPGELFR
ncbi:hypothetical protein IG631_10129 [Alternaria alternata]|nr:hypothetical protein IG631_10129 [Alternaria alternata]